MLAHVTVYLEEGDIREMGTGDFQDIGSIFGQNPGDSWTGDDTAEFKDFDSFQSLFAPRATSGERG